MTLIKINLNFIKKLTQFWILSTLEFQFQIQFQLLVIRTFNFFEVFIHFSYILTQGYVSLPSFWVILTILPKKNLMQENLIYHQGAKFREGFC